MRVQRVKPSDWAFRLIELQEECLPHDDPYPVRDEDVWHIVRNGEAIVGFSCARTLGGGGWYMARSGIVESARGAGLQVRLLRARLRAIRALGGTWAVSDCTNQNPASARSLWRAGFRPYWPEEPWALPNSIYWKRVYATD